MNQVKIKETETYLAKVNSIISKFVYALVPLLVMALFFFYAGMNNLYPFGNKTIAWCDMEQQAIPVYNQLKDILEGKQSFVYNFTNAGGTSFWGVFFFFLSSPFSFLVVFVSKADMSAFMNILVMLKLMAIGFSASFYLSKKYPNQNVLINIAFSLLYAYSAYNLMYYQIILWLDLVFVFPLLLLSIDYLLEKDKYIFYAIMICLSVVINFYIGAILVLFVLLYISVNLILRRKQENIKKIAMHFILSSICAAMISMLVIVPTFIQYIQSARTISVFDSIRYSVFITPYTTILPMLLPLVFVFPFMFFKGKDKNPNILSKIILLLMMLVPVIIEPINKMWHLGSYQCFPCRFMFVNVFLCLDIACYSLSLPREEKDGKYYIYRLVSFIGCLVLVGLLFKFESVFVQEKIGYLNKYATSLWGNSVSFEALCRYYFIIIFAGLFLFLLFKLKILSKRGLSVAFVGLALIETSFSFKIYAVVPSKSVESYQNYYEIENMIKDDSFYRVKTDAKYRNVNDLGGAGYNNFGHYTSLTNEDYMFTMKALGYSSYWMEVGSYGGTAFTDAMLLNKYTIYQGKNSSAPYSSSSYYALENPVYPFGIVTTSSLKNKENFTKETRAEKQDEMASTLLNETGLHTIYKDFETSNCTYSYDGTHHFTNVGTNAKATFDIHVDGNQTLYFECFDEYSNSLSEHINGIFSVYVNGSYRVGNYPSQSSNGTINLGNISNRDVKVVVNISKDVYCKSFSVYSVDKDKLSSSIQNCKSPSLVQKKNKFVGSYDSTGDESLFLPLIYNSGIKAKINGKRVEVDKTFSCFASIKLKEGKNNIEISFSQPGIGVGISITTIGIILFGTFIFFDKKNKIKDIKWLNDISYYLVIAVGVIVAFVLYVVPIILNVLQQINLLS